MKRIALVAVILGLSALAVLGGEGTIVFQGGHGAKALGMGGAFTAIADDATGALWNPAGLAHIQGLWVGGATTSLFATEGFEGVGYQFASLGTTFQGYGVGLAWASATAGELYSANMFLGSIAASFPLGEELSLDIGVNIKYYMETIAESTESAFGFDIGILMPIGDSFTIGAAALDIATKIGEDTITPVYRVGAVGNFLDGAVKISSDVEMVNMELSALRLGMSIKLIEMLQLRAGAVVPGMDFDKTYFSLGAGLSIADLEIDAAYVLQDEPGESLILSASYNFKELFAPKEEEAVGAE